MHFKWLRDDLHVVCLERAFAIFPSFWMCLCASPITNLCRIQQFKGRENHRSKNETATLPTANINRKKETLLWINITRYVCLHLFSISEEFSIQFAIATRREYYFLGDTGTYTHNMRVCSASYSFFLPFKYLNKSETQGKKYYTIRIMLNLHSILFVNGVYRHSLHAY